MTAGTGTARAQVCDTRAAKFIAVAGEVEISRGATSDWTPAATGDEVCRGDAVKVLVFASAVLELVDGNKAIINESSTLRFTEDPGDGFSLINLIKGVIHLLSRDSQSLKFSTPFTNAGLDGTEFLLAVTDESTEITVIEGAVTMSRDDGSSLRVESGQTGTAGDGAPLALEQTADVQQEMAWNLYFEPIMAGDLPAPDQAPTAAEAVSAQFYAARAASHLNRGLYSGAVADLEQAQSIDANNAEALALRASIELALNRTAAALALAESAVAADPGSVAALVVLSHARQSSFDLAGAEDAAAAAAEMQPGNALAVGRQAELRLVADDVRGAMELAERAIELDPGLYIGYTIRGFGHARNLDFDAAREDFGIAIEREPAAPLPHFGLGQTLLRLSEIEAGQRELDVAVALAPNDPEFRSYASNAYFEDERIAVADSQIELAKQFAPTEPTAAVFAAPQEQAANRPVNAFRALQSARMAGSLIPVTRSSSRLDEDLAVRSAARGRIFRDIGLGDWAQMIGARAIQWNPSDYGGHRLLTDIWSTRPDHEIARSSELVVSQLLQPLSVTPIPPELGEANLPVADEFGPDAVAFSEYSRPVTRDHWTPQGSFIAAGNGTAGERISVSGLSGRISYSIGHYGIRTDGFRENNDLDASVNNVFFQYQINSRTSLLAEFRSTESEKGDRNLRFNPSNYLATARQNQSVDSLRLGFRHNLNERITLIGLLNQQDTSTTYQLGDRLSNEGTVDGYAHELVGMVRLDRWNLTAGLLDSANDQFELGQFTVSIEEPPFEVDVEAAESVDVSQESMFAYGDYRFSDAVTITVGASVESLSYRQGAKDQFNPKFGVIWVMPSGMTFRAAAFRTLQGALISRQTAPPRLEPSQVAGFAQYLFGSVGDEARRLGLGVDHSLGENIFLGAEVSARRVESAFLFNDVDGFGIRHISFDEQFGRAYLQVLPSDSFSYGVELERDQIDNNGIVLFNSVTELNTTRVALGMKHFRPGGLTAGFKLKHIDQSGIIAANQGTIGDPYRDSDQFWVADASVRYKLPRRRGDISLSVQNLFDQEFRYQGRDLETPRITPERLVSLRFTLAY